MKTPKNKHIDLTAAQKLIKNRKRPIDPQVLSAEILAGNTIALSRAITLIESTISAHQKTAQEILAACLPHTKNALRVGITGVPGVGKST
ncbi:MAG TPA: methylmalonyl Co-A mutase-associated GTPase MeaB, partial [Leeuwenhoekiella sp.]|nr:methylmalonyl Co-A mutase-associated GTPase MeaB [Leeuwenhoekiella sp.]